MPEEFDPAWEYWTPSEEMEELVPQLSSRGSCDPFAELGIEEFRLGRSGLPSGYRFGQGNPDRFSGHEGRKRKSRREVKDASSKLFKKPRREKIVLSPRLCMGCGVLFQPYRNILKYCSRKCVPRLPNFGRKRVLPDSFVCEWCGEKYRPNKSNRRVCSMKCRDELHRAPSTEPTSKKGTVAVCLGCNKTKTINARGLCRWCYGKRLIRNRSPKAKGYRAWSSFDVRRLVVLREHGLSVKVVAKILKRNPREVVCKSSRLKLRCGQMGPVARLGEKPEMSMPTVGTRVRLCVPSEPAVDGLDAIIESTEEWGAHVVVQRQTRAYDVLGHIPRFRALWSEMLPLEPNPPRESGFTGGICKQCQGLRLVRTGTCVTCLDCGDNEGCG